MNYNLVSQRKYAWMLLQDWELNDKKIGRFVMFEERVFELLSNCFGNNTDFIKKPAFWGNQLNIRKKS